uniref:Uncharacterized protein n=1 Tax=Cannabis sativa TaxID=3483 RepID=A0A803PHY2_CANSA
MGGELSEGLRHGGGLGHGASGPFGSVLGGHTRRSLVGLRLRTPYEIWYYFELKSGPKQSRTDYFYFSQLGHQWLGDTNCKAMSKVDKYYPVNQCGQLLDAWLVPLAPEVVRVPTTSVACLRDGQGPNLDDEEAPLSSIVQNLERRERALHRRLARGGQVGDASLHIGPRDPASDRLAHPMPTRLQIDLHTLCLHLGVARTSLGANASGPSLPPPPPGPAPAEQPMVQPASQGTRRPSRGAGSDASRKAAQSATRNIERTVPFLDEALHELGDALYKLADHGVTCMWLAGLGHPYRERVKVFEASLAAKDRANFELEFLLAKKQRMVSRLEIMLSARNTENTNQVALISGLQTDLEEHKKKLHEALDGQQAIKEYYLDLSFELTYEFFLGNPQPICHTWAVWPLWREHWPVERH